MKILVYQLPELATTLSAPPLRKQGVAVIATHSAEDLVLRARLAQPDVVIALSVNPVVDERIGQELRAAMRTKPSLVFLARREWKTPMFWSSELFDGVLHLEDPEARLSKSGIPWSAAWARRERRIATTIPVEVACDGGESIVGTATELSRGGARATLPWLPRTAGPYRVRFYRDDGRAVWIRARAAWISIRGDGAFEVGLHFFDLGHDAGGALHDLALWELVPGPDGPVICLHGEISEETPLLTLGSQITRTPRIDLGAVLRINVMGAFRLLELFKAVPQQPMLRVRRVPGLLLRQAQLGAAIFANCVVESFFMTFDCERCKLEVTSLYAAGAALLAACPFCGGELRDVTSANVHSAADAVSSH